MLHGKTIPPTKDQQEGAQLIVLAQRQGQLWCLPSGSLLGRKIEFHSDAVGVLQEDLIDVLATGLLFHLFNAIRLQMD